MGDLARLVMKTDRSFFESQMLASRLDQLDALLSRRTEPDTWIDYSELSIITGWSAYTQKKIFYKLTGNMVWVQFYIYGTSNDTLANFTLPFYISNLIYKIAIVIRIVDNSISAAGLAQVTAGYKTVDCYATQAAEGFTASGNKGVMGILSYQRGTPAVA